MDGMFEKNQDALKSCANFHMNFDELPTTEGKPPQAESRVKNFLSQVRANRLSKERDENLKSC